MKEEHLSKLPKKSPEDISDLIQTDVPSTAATENEPPQLNTKQLEEYRNQLTGPRPLFETSKNNYENAMLSDLSQPANADIAANLLNELEQKYRNYRQTNKPKLMNAYNSYYEAILQNIAHADLSKES